jgi:hypothetical protein
LTEAALRRAPETCGSQSIANIGKSIFQRQDFREIRNRDRYLRFSSLSSGFDVVIRGNQPDAISVFYSVFEFSGGKIGSSSCEIIMKPASYSTAAAADFEVHPPYNSFGLFFI